MNQKSGQKKIATIDHRERKNKEYKMKRKHKKFKCKVKMTYIHIIEVSKTEALFKR